MGIIHYFDWAIFNSYVNVYQRVFELIGIWGGFTEFAEIGGDVTETIGIKRGQIWILYIYMMRATRIHGFLDGESWI
jgi:hypothetical protein